jgi:hypothetical protein
LREIALQDFGSCFSNIKLVDKFVRECQKTIKYTGKI